MKKTLPLVALLLSACATSHFNNEPFKESLYPSEYVRMSKGERQGYLKAIAYIHSRPDYERDVANEQTADCMNRWPVEGDNWQKFDKIIHEKAKDRPEYLPVDFTFDLLAVFDCAGSTSTSWIDNPANYADSVIESTHKVKAAFSDVEKMMGTPGLSKRKDFKTLQDAFAILKTQSDELEARSVDLNSAKLLYLKEKNQKTGLSAAKLQELEKRLFKDSDTLQTARDAFGQNLVLLSRAARSDNKILLREAEQSPAGKTPEQVWPPHLRRNEGAQDFPFVVKKG